MTDFTLSASVRSDKGKGASRRLRREAGLVPAVVYGGQAQAQSITLKANEVKKAASLEAFYSHILNLDIDGKVEQVVLKDVQRHPFKPVILHMDFQRVVAGQKITKTVPLHYTNEDKAPGVKAGGIVSHMLTEVEVRCEPKDLPEFIAVDLVALDLDQIVHLSDIQWPKGVESTHLSHDDDQAIASIHMPRAAVEQTDVAAEAKAAEGDA